MTFVQSRLKGGFASVVVVLVVLVFSAGLVFLLINNQKGVANAQNTAITACSADVNGDGMVDSADLKAVSSQFGTKAGAPYDVNGDGTVDILDLSAASKLVGQACAKNASAANQFACIADLNHDGVVNKPDLNLVADQMGKAGSADINGDGIVDILDLSKVANSFGRKCAANATSFCAIADADRSGTVNAKDLQLVAGDFGKKSQYDMDGDGTITMVDLSKVASYVGQSCGNVSSGAAPGLAASPTPTSNPGSASVPTPDTRIANNCNGADVDRDGSVTILDLQLVQKDYGKASQYDTDGDGKISILDISKVNANYGKQCKA